MRGVALGKNSTASAIVNSLNPEDERDNSFVINVRMG
jgi:hypothetical protein